QARGLGVAQQNVTFHLLAMIDHDVHYIAALDGEFTGRREKLFGRNDAFGFVTEVDNHIFLGETKNGPLQNFVGRRWSKMTVVFEQMLVTLRDHLVHLPVVLVYGHEASAERRIHRATEGPERFTKMTQRMSR